MMKTEMNHLYQFIIKEPLSNPKFDYSEMLPSYKHSLIVLKF